MLVLVHRLDEGRRATRMRRIQVTVLNFSDEPIEGTVHSEELSCRGTT